MDSREPFHWCCCSGVKRLDNHWLLWGRPRSRFPLQGMVGPDWRVGAWTFFSIPTGTVVWGCLILFGAPDDGSDLVRAIIVAIGVGMALLTMVLYLCTACTDPGIAFKHLATAATSAGQQQQQQQQQHQHRSADGGGGGGGGGGFGQIVMMAPAGAGTPVPAAAGAVAGTNPAKISATAVVAAGDVEEGKGVAEWAGSEDWEAKQMLKILTDEYHEGALSSQTAPLGAAAAAAAAAGGAGVAEGLPPEECVAAVDAGSTAVADMRNAPPPEDSSPLRTPPLPAQVSNRQQQQQQVGVGIGGGDSATVCGRCQIERPPGTIHCTRCGVCVQKLDHHCPFMGQCVGRKTLVPFYLFVVSVWSLVVYVLVAVAYLIIAVVTSGF
ncbi:unnamed protein product [Pylaiella littoralis]